VACRILPAPGSEPVASIGPAEVIRFKLLNIKLIIILARQLLYFKCPSQAAAGDAAAQGPGQRRIRTRAASGGHNEDEPIAAKRRTREPAG
jgi:hypothetical protein